jgi:hypothetical protein
LAAALHAFLMFDISSHQSTEEAEVELTDLDIVLRKVMKNAVLAFDAGKLVAVVSIDDFSSKSSLVHNLDDFGDTLDAVLPDKTWNSGGRRIDTKIEHISSELARADLSRSLSKRTRENHEYFFGKLSMPASVST